MFNLFRSDMYRLVHGMKFWVATVCATVVPVCLYLPFVLLSAGTATESSVPVGDGSFTVSTDAAAFAGRIVESHIQLVERYSGFITGGLLPMIAAALIGLLVVEDYDSGFVKGLPGGVRGRMSLMLGHMATGVAVSAWLVLTYVAAMEATFALLGFRYRKAEGIGAYAGFVLLCVLAMMTYEMIIAAVAWLTRSKVATVIAFIAIPGGTVYQLLQMVMGLLSSFGVDWAGAVAQWLPSHDRPLIGSSAQITSTMGSVDSGIGTTAGMPVWVHAAVCFIGWIVLACGVSALVERRRDIR